MPKPRPTRPLIATALFGVLTACGDGGGPPRDFASYDRYVEADACEQAAGVELASRGVALAQMSDVGWFILSTGELFNGPRSPVGYYMTGRPEQCESGSVRLDFSMGCTIQRRTGRGGCAYPESPSGG